MDKIVAFDVETPNGSNNKICSIGLTIIESGKITGSQYYLVNPECGFDDRNIQIHGISPRDIRDEPPFPDIWDIIGPLFRTHLIAAHNAAFDLCVLKKTLQAYDIREPLVSYVDTLAIARATVKDIENHRLSTLCDWYGIPLEHHNAGSDSDACARLLCRFRKAGANLERYIKTYPLTPVHRCVSGI